ncbi:MAG: DUF1273 domain-containing protein [Oscillospiraceae bacterium]|nr:DUF1273 domain-containing protein [Oscillospiraceae bacterium]
MKKKVICTVTGRSFSEIGNGRTEIFSENADIILSLREKIDKLVRSGITDFICHAEYGFPLWCAEYIIELRDIREELGLSPIRLCAVRVHEGQQSGWSRDIQCRYFNVLDDADVVKCFSDSRDADSHSKCEKLMIDCCHFIMTDVCDSFAVQYAQINAKPIVFCGDVCQSVKFRTPSDSLS